MNNITESNAIKKLAYDEKYEKYYNHMNDNLDEEYTSINNLIGQIKPLILCDEIYGEPNVLTIQKYGIEASHTITVFVRYGKELAKCVIQAFPITGYGIGKVRLLQLKEVKLKDNRNIIFEILKMCNNVEIVKVLSNKSSTSIIFSKASKSLCDMICSKYKDANRIMLNNGIKINNSKSVKESSDDIFDLPSEDNIVTESNESYNSVVELLDNTDPKNIYLSSDWHIFKNHYKKEKNLVNTANIIKYCKGKFKEDTVFIFVGDLTFRYANKEDNDKAAELIKSIPGKKILILGNHDKMLGEDVYSNFGFDYVFEKLEYYNILFTHRPEEVEEGWINIHGHIHDIVKYNTTDGKRNVNVYPYNFDNKPVTLYYILNHIDELIKDNVWNNNAMLGECVEMIKSIASDLTYNFDQESDMESFYNEIKKYKSYGTQPDLNSCIVIETKRSEIPTEEFGIPQERKYPLDTESHVRSAVKMFNYVQPEYEKQLATAVIKKMKKFGINDMKISKENRLYRYMHEDSSIESENDFFSFIPSNIKNIIFDMGKVLVDNNTVELYKKSILIPTEYAEEIYDFTGEHFFGDMRNPELLTCDLEYAIKYFKEIAPSHLSIYADEIFKLMGEAIFIFDYTDYLIQDLRNRGYKIYYLSNWDKYSYEQHKYVFDKLLNKFDGGLFSFEAECEKPEPEIYYKLIDTYDLLPSECFFFDDRKENIFIGNKIGMWGLHYTDKFRQKIERYYKTGYNDSVYKEAKSLTGFPPINIPNCKTFAFNEYMIGQLDYSKHNWWHLNIKSKPAPIDEELFSKSIEYAILNDCKDEYFKDSNKVEMYVYTCNGEKNGELDLKLIPVGIITIYKGNDNKKDWDWEWAEQYDIKVTDEGIINLDKLNESSHLINSVTKTIKEWSMASTNPVIKTNKPFILKIGSSNNGLLSKSKFAFAPNLLDDKYFVINEDGHPEYVKGDYFKDNEFELYEFVGPKEYIDEMFNHINLGPNEFLSQDFIYNELSGGRLLINSDQIKFDENFKLIEKN